MAAPDAPLQTRVVDDKSPICIPFILSRLAEYKKQHAGEANPRPFIVGLNGVQGVGKTTLVRALAETLQEREGLPTLVVSIDDFYLTHADQLALAAAHPDNALVQYRGEPGTHDIPLLTTFLTALTTNHHPTPIPQYSKSAFSGLGDRLPPSTWPHTSPTAPPRVLILEGWCIGFRPLPSDLVAQKWSAPSRTLHNHKLSHLEFINARLADYDAVIKSVLDAFIHIDAEDTEYVYAWRAEQEAQLRRETGDGMSAEQVVKFVDAYYPAYELFTDGVRRGVFEGVPGREGCQLRVVVGRDRGVVESMVI
ncbi:P-loop containing nucleoside triphosphate hydrolase protein [Parachaetomium inaequale]|uniref:P-loop containing nucleoside triphosphate hydrolase protein n=1 Tax=Parachaetomium inaequale TaxID=2588326 RepID=A0AAN6PLL1_9PEZI|nr:P-loop containing nucleoside triphosphate hydrolase protein [Parachaetomium inaequale]